MKILALDASTTAIGWAYLDLAKRHPDDLGAYGLEKLTGELFQRLCKGLAWRQGAQWPADCVAIETPVVYMVKQPGGRWKPRNPQSAIKQGYMVGVLGASAYEAGLQVLELRPDERLTALGLAHNTRDPKPQVVNLINQIYRLELDHKGQHDIADAIAIGWAARRRLLQEGRLET